MKSYEKIIQSLAKKVGFDLVGFAKVEELTEETEKLVMWIENKYHAGMDYLERNLEKRKNVKELFPDANSVISVGLNYYNDEKYSDKLNYGKVSRYAWGEDYHFVMWDMMDELIKLIKHEINVFEGKRYVDSAPVMDKVWAIKSGLGWMGKNSNIINKNIGSYFFIGNIINNLKLDSGNLINDFCGTCTDCIESCPTDAIVSSRVIDSNKCISYLTIENKKEIPDEFIGKFDSWIFGCDICQEVCPWNIKFAVKTKTMRFLKSENVELNLNDVMNYDNEKFSQKFNRSPIKRAKLSGLKRNAEHLQKL